MLVNVPALPAGQHFCTCQSSWLPVPASCFAASAAAAAFVSAAEDIFVILKSSGQSESNNAGRRQQEEKEQQQQQQRILTETAQDKRFVILRPRVFTKYSYSHLDI